MLNHQTLESTMDDLSSSQDLVLDSLRQIVGPDRVSCDAGELYCYSFDSSYVRGQADYVVRPVAASEVAAVVRIASVTLTPIVPTGFGKRSHGRRRTGEGGHRTGHDRHESHPGA